MAARVFSVGAVPDKGWLTACGKGKYTQKSGIPARFVLTVFWQTGHTNMHTARV